MVHILDNDILDSLEEISQEDIPKHRKRKTKDKQFIIEYKYDSKNYKTDWGIFKRYETKKRQEEAYNRLTKKEKKYFTIGYRKFRKITLK